MASAVGQWHFSFNDIKKLSQLTRTIYLHKQHQLVEKSISKYASFLEKDFSSTFFFFSEN